MRIVKIFLIITYMTLSNAQSGESMSRNYDNYWKQKVNMELSQDDHQRPTFEPSAPQFDLSQRQLLLPPQLPPMGMPEMPPFVAPMQMPSLQSIAMPPLPPMQMPPLPPMQMPPLPPMQMPPMQMPPLPPMQMPPLPPMQMPPLPPMQMPPLPPMEMPPFEQSPLPTFEQSPTAPFESKQMIEQFDVERNQGKYDPPGFGAGLRRHRTRYDKGVPFGNQVSQPHQPSQSSMQYPSYAHGQCGLSGQISNSYPAIRPVLTPCEALCGTQQRFPMTPPYGNGFSHGKNSVRMAMA